MKLAVFAALTASVIAVCPEKPPQMAVFTDDKCTTAYEPKTTEKKTEEKTTEEKTDEKKEEPKEEPKAEKPESGKCEKYVASKVGDKHYGYYIDSTASGKLTAHILANAGKDVYAKVDCSAESLKVEAFTDDKCETKIADSAFEYEWGTCLKGKKEGDTQLYVHYSGAKALQVAAVAVLAFASSQF